MAVVTIGSTVSEYASYDGPTITQLTTNDPADGTGVIDTIHLWVKLAGTFWVGIFEHTGNGAAVCRSAVQLGYLTVGEHTITPVSLAVVTGDVIGFYSDTGRLAANAASGDPHLYRAGNYCVQDDLFGVASYGTYTHALQGTGQTITLEERSQAIYDALDDAEGIDLDGAMAWVNDNRKFLPTEDMQLALLAALRLDATGGDGGVTLAQLQGELASQLATIEGRLDTVDASLSSLSTQLSNGIIAINGHTDVVEGNIASDISVAAGNIDASMIVETNAIDAAIAALDPASSQDVLDAVASIKGISDKSLTDIWNALAVDIITDTIHSLLDGVGSAVAVVDGGVQALDTAIGGIDTVLQGVDTVADTINGKCDTLQTTVEGIPAEVDLQPVLDAIAAIDIPEGLAAPVWPGLAGVTLGTPVALVDGLHIQTAMHGVLVTVTTPPTRTGLLSIGGAYFDYREGEIAFETDNGEIEPWQYLGFRTAVFTPKTMAQAAGCRLRVLAGTEGLVTPWTIA